ncbi:MAG: DUF6159 family protein [Kiritimatiellae bacterium]|jgi:hypothetical protein|nr:DUF6159 family protein [Kiritimatiellia bacterium]
MFATLSRSWEFAKMSYRLVWEYPRLLLYPIISSIASMLVTASFLLPLWQTGRIEEWMQFMGDESATQGNMMMYFTAFLFYFCSYFIIVFFNTGLIACVLKVINGEKLSISYGLSFAVKRLPQILGWALVSAVIGVLLKLVEKSNKKAGAFIAALMGSAWTALTYFIVPVIVVDGVGPIEAFKRSTRTLKSTWGTALTGNFSLGFFSFLLTLPVILIMFGLFWWFGLMNNSVTGMIVVGVIAVPVIMFTIAITSAADTIFKAYLYTYATGQTVPTNVDTRQFSNAFSQRNR